MVKNELYIELFHGRADKDRDMDDWGSTGPVFGPLCYAHTTYGNEIKLGQDGDEYGVLRVNDGMVYYNGIWYGDWSVFPAFDLCRSDWSADSTATVRRGKSSVRIHRQVILWRRGIEINVSV